ncbi:MAG: ROK family protein [Actinomycetota bacterium]|nr:ROK family protein [Actinomycetota bacterium]
MPVALAVDIGGTKLAAGLVDTEGNLLVRHRSPTPATPDGELLLATVIGVAREVLEQVPERPVVCGVAAAGPMTEGGEEVSPLNMPAWRGFPLRSRLAEELGLDTFVDNDAKALALGEGWVGGGRGRGSFIAMVVSTGVGGGMVLEGRLLGGRTGNAGHIGHVLVEPDGHLCGCGARGCLEAEASGTAIARITGRPAQEADEATIERTGEMVGRAVASVANLCDLDLALVSGSVALGFGAPFFDAAQAALRSGAMLDHSAASRILPGALGHAGPLVGAGAVGWMGLGADPLSGSVDL